MKHRNFTRSFHVRSYSGRRLRNPFFSHEPTQYNPILVVTGVIAVFLLLAAGFLYAPFLRYDNIRIDGLTTLSADTVRQTAESIVDHQKFLIVPGNHVIFLPHRTLIQTLNTQYNFANLVLEREGATLVIRTEERITQIAWIAGDVTYLVDLAGIAVSEADEATRLAITARQTVQAADAVATQAPGLQPTMPVLVNSNADPVTLGQTVFSADKLANILILDKALRERGIIPLDYTFDEAQAPWTTVRTATAGLLIDVTKDIVEALTMFDAFRDEREESLDTLRYIDLRFGNRIYIHQK